MAKNENNKGSFMVYAPKYSQSVNHASLFYNIKVNLINTKELLMESVYAKFSSEIMFELARIIIRNL